MMGIRTITSEVKITSNTMMPFEGMLRNTKFSNRGITTIQRISGKIYVPISDELYKKIGSGPGVATFLEGGVVTISDVRPYAERYLTEMQQPIEAKKVTPEEYKAIREAMKNVPNKDYKK
jgi:hypothetical protein